MEDVVHHPLECRGRVREPKEHDGGLIQASVHNLEIGITVRESFPDRTGSSISSEFHYPWLEKNISGVLSRNTTWSVLHHPSNEGADLPFRLQQSQCCVQIDYHRIEQSAVGFM